MSTEHLVWFMLGGLFVFGLLAFSSYVAMRADIRDAQRDLDRAVAESEAMRKDHK